MKKVSPEIFRRSTGCTNGELRLLMRSNLTGYNATTHLFDDGAARLVLAAIRQARAEDGKAP